MTNAMAARRAYNYREPCGRSNNGSALTRRLKKQLLGNVTVKSNGRHQNPAACISGEIEALMSARESLSPAYECTTITTYSWGSQFYATAKSV